MRVGGVEKGWKDLLVSFSIGEGVWTLGQKE